MDKEPINLATFEFTGEEMYHYGRKGMKWGRHIFSKTTGSVTGSKRKKKSNSISSKLAARKKAKAAEKQREKEVKKALSETAKLKKKSLDEMTDDEIAKAIRRTQLEEQYKKLHPEKESRFKKIVSTAFNDAIAPALLKSGQSFLENALKKYGDKLLGNDPDPESLDSLKNEFNRLWYKDQVNKIKNGGKAATNTDSDGVPNPGKPGKPNEPKKPSDYDSNKPPKPDSPPKAKTKADKSSDKTKNEDDTDNETYTGEAQGEGTSRRKSNSFNKRANDDIVYDAEYEDITYKTTTSNLPAIVTSRGSSYVSGLLTAPNNSSSGNSGHSNETSDINKKLFDNASKLSRVAKESSKMAEAADAGQEYVEELLKRNNDLLGL